LLDEMLSVVGLLQLRLGMVLVEVLLSVEVLSVEVLVLQLEA
jgi:hypothetical protein